MGLERADRYRKRYILGGAWNDPDYQFLYSDVRSPFDRSDTNGFRCVVYGAGPAPAASLAAPIVVPADDFATRQPVADAVYRIYADRAATIARPSTCA